jgi:shikimate kinase
MQQPVFLWGFMGCGKSHLGRALANRLQHPFVDTDTFLEEVEGRTIAAIFEAEGEAGFRQLERRYLTQLAEKVAVVATGGGAPCFFDNADWMNAHGLTVYLDTPVVLLAQRLYNGRQHRPLLRDLDEAGLVSFIETRLAARRPFYEKAKIIIQQNSNGPETLENLLEAIVL